MATTTRSSLLFFGALLLAGTLAGGASAQSFSLNADIVSRYIWRGYDFGESASIQPTLAFNAGGFQLGTWASYAINPESAGANEHDLWASYTIPAGSAGAFTVGVTDYYFPNAGVDFFNFENEGGAHWIEPFVSYTGPSSFPITLYGGMFVHNDPDNSTYLSATFPFTVSDVSLAVTAAGTTGQSALYFTEGAGMTYASLSATKDIPITDAFTLPVSVSYIVNPYAEKSFLVFGVRL